MNDGLKRLLFTTLLLSLLFTTALPVLAAEESQNEPIVYHLDAGLLIQGNVLVPLRDITDVLDAALTWDASAQSIKLEKEGTIVLMKIGELGVQVNGVKHTLGTSPRIEDSKTFVPLRLIGEAFGAAVDWNKQDQIATIQTKTHTLYVTARPYLVWNGNRFVYNGEMANGLPHGQGSAVKGTNIYSDVWYTGRWEHGTPVGLAASSTPSGEYTLYINGNYQQTDVAPFVRDNVTYVPLRALVSGLQLSLQEYEGVTRIDHPRGIALIDRYTSLITYVDSNKVIHRDRLSAPTIFEQDRLYVPAEFVKKYLGLPLTLNDDKRIDVTREGSPRNVTWNMDTELRPKAKQLQMDNYAEMIWDHFRDTLWSKGREDFPGLVGFNQYEKLNVVSYNGLTVTFSNGKKTGSYTFSSIENLIDSFYAEDPLASYNWSSKIKDQVRQGIVSTGMNEMQVLLSWGVPDSVNEYRLFTQWTYWYRDFNADFVYFKNGVVSSLSSF